MQEQSFSVIYLTGPPASGKSTLLAALSAAISPLIPFSYSKALAEHVEVRTGRRLSENGIRTESARAVTLADVASVDAALMDLVSQNRQKSHVVIDSHAVTKETYGFRVTPFTIPMLLGIAPTMIVMLYTTADLAIERISRNPQGRPVPTPPEALLHTELQSSVALFYGLQLGIPVYFLDAMQPTSTLVEEISLRVARG